MDNIIAAVVFIIAVILFIVFTILASQVPKLSEGNVSAVLMWIGIITLLVGMIIHFSVTPQELTEEQIALFEKEL